MNILILHRMGNPKNWRQSVAELELALPKYAPEHNYLVHNAAIPLPGYIREMKFNGIILGPTFLCARYNPFMHNKFLVDYSFIKDSGAFKIALPQDDYDCSAVLDRWMVDWQIDKVYTVCPEHWDKLYPRYLQRGGNLALGYTGYITNDLISRSKVLHDISKRKVDVCYRAIKLLPNFGSLGMMKSEIASLFSKATENHNLIKDVSTETKDVIPGLKWLDFIESARCTLGSNSGSSLLDPEGEIRRCVNSILDVEPEASFEEVEANCFPGLDSNYIFTAISPRVLEAGMLKTAQILIPGPYSGFIEPWEHYIPLKEDMSNIEEVVSAIKDVLFLRRITEECKNRLLSYPQLRMETHVGNLMNDINGSNSCKTNYNDFCSTEKYIKMHKKYSCYVGYYIWLKEDLRRFIYNKVPSVKQLYVLYKKTLVFMRKWLNAQPM